MREPRAAGAASRAGVVAQGIEDEGGEPTRRHLLGNLAQLARVTALEVPRLAVRVIEVQRVLFALGLHDERAVLGLAAGLALGPRHAAARLRSRARWMAAAVGRCAA